MTRPKKSTSCQPQQTRLTILSCPPSALSSNGVAIGAIGESSNGTAIRFQSNAIRDSPHRSLPLTKHAEDADSSPKQVPNCNRTRRIMEISGYPSDGAKGKKRRVQEHTTSISTRSMGHKAADSSAKTHAYDTSFGEPESSDDGARTPFYYSSRRKTKVKGKSKMHSVDEDSEEISFLTRKKGCHLVSHNQEVPVPAAFRRRPSTSKRERDELAEDMEFFGSSHHNIDLYRSPRKVTPAINARRKALEALKRRRAGEKEPCPKFEDSEPGSSQDEGEEASTDNEEITDATDNESAAMDMFRYDQDDTDFIVEDDDEPIGAPDEDAEMPLKFSSIGRAKSKDLFKYAVEWMVQKTLNPGLAKYDDVYRLTFSKLDDEVRGLAGSKFTSGAWTPDFTRALKARPCLTATEIGGVSRHLLENYCQACNRRGHPATWDIVFQGKPYKSDSLSDIEGTDTSDTDGDQDDDRRSVDANGQRLLPESAVFHVGVHCKSNAATAHMLMHWRWHLYNWVKDHLRIQGHFDADRIVERDDWKTAKKIKYANHVVGEMQANGKIKRLWQDFRDAIDTAREVKLSGPRRTFG